MIVKKFRFKQISVDGLLKDPEEFGYDHVLTFDVNNYSKGFSTEEEALEHLKNCDSLIEGINRDWDFDHAEFVLVPVYIVEEDTNAS